MKRIARSAIVARPAARVYALVEDIESYPTFLPWCAEAHVHERSPERTVATLVARAAGLRQSFTTENRNRPGEAIEMRLLEGPFRHFEALWRFRPLGPQACRVEFTMRWEFASRALAKLLEPLFGRIAQTMVEAFLHRLDELDGRVAR